LNLTNWHDQVGKELFRFIEELILFITYKLDYGSASSITNLGSILLYLIMLKYNKLDRFARKQ